MKLSFENTVCSYTGCFICTDSKAVPKVTTESSFPAELLTVGSHELGMTISVSFVIVEFAFNGTECIRIPFPSPALLSVIYKVSVVETSISVITSGDSVHLITCKCARAYSYSCCATDKTSSCYSVSILSFIVPLSADNIFDKAMKSCRISLASAS